jgi:hypothetical protein
MNMHAGEKSSITEQQRGYTEKTDRVGGWATITKKHEDS